MKWWLALTYAMLATISPCTAQDLSEAELQASLSEYLKAPEASQAILTISPAMGQAEAALKPEQFRKMIATCKPLDSGSRLGDKSPGKATMLMNWDDCDEAVVGQANLSGIFEFAGKQVIKASIYQLGIVVARPPSERSDSKQ